MRLYVLFPASDCDDFGGCEAVKSMVHAVCVAAYGKSDPV